MRRMHRRFARLSLLVLGLVGAVAVGSAVANKNTKLAALLAERDPGARVGGNTIVGTGSSEDLYAVPGRPNFIIAIGNGEVIHGNAAGDELGALGKHVKIIAPAAGHALIEGGPQSTIVVGGKGHDLVVEHKPRATIKVMAPGIEIIATGPHDRVVCGPSAHDEEITLGKTDTVSASCRGHHDTINHRSASHSSRARAHPAAIMTGRGTNGDPYVAPCSEAPPPDDPCPVIYFEPRKLDGLWANEDVPAYRCPADHKYLRNVNYAPFGTTVPNGVEVLRLGSIGVSITRALLEPPPATTAYSIGTRTREGNEPVSPSSATSWTIGPASYKIILHCTNDRSSGY